ncbi:hypothetical protein I7I48_07958 [Histoplasma ohiense]|nr:hypothetical protein I7I48_07958 [Histoplasma ohiense (nom. inval.)]
MLVFSPSPNLLFAYSALSLSYLIQLRQRLLAFYDRLNVSLALSILMSKPSPTRTYYPLPTYRLHPLPPYYYILIYVSV